MNTFGCLRKDLGTPIARGRCYILMVRKVTMSALAKPNFGKFVKELTAVAKVNLTVFNSWPLGMKHAELTANETQFFLVLPSKA